jgi:fluoroquinolone transport system permease protein
MRELVHFLKHDFLLLNRNRIIQISALVTLVYIAVFKGLSTFGNMDQLLVLVIFNDPALLGFLFIGVMMLFEKNENTLQVLAISPFDEKKYVLSKSISLTTISLICCLGMAIAAHGKNFHWIHFSVATILTSLLFSFLGFIVVANENSFNRYILKALGWLLSLSIPFIGYFGLTDYYWFILFPTQPAIDLFQASFDETLSVGRIIYAYAALILWTVLSYLWAVRSVTKNIQK